MKLLGVVSILLLGVACGAGEHQHAAPTAPTAPAARAPHAAGAGLRLAVTPDPATPRSGANRLRIRVEDAEGRSVDDAEVVVQLRMDMPGMASSGARASATPMGDGAYEASVELGMAGTWRLVVAATRASGETARAEGALTTGTPGVRLEATAAQDAAAKAIAGGADVRIDEGRRRQIGIRSAEVVRAPFERVVRAPGRVVVDESALVDVSLKVRGWVQVLHANALGMKVERGATLFTLYSPELFAAQAELLTALHSQRAARASSAVDRVDALVRASRTRLRLWDVSEGDIAALVKRDHPHDALPVRSPASGFLVQKYVVQGAAVEPGVTLLRIAPLDRMWIEAEIPESEQAALQAGQLARVTFAGEPDRPREARVAYVYPTLERATRTARIRLELSNADGALRPEAFASVELRIPSAEALLVPASAVLYAGPRRVVFVDLGDGRLRPTEVTLGPGNGESFEVLSGLEAGQRVIVSGNFLVAAESRLASALEQW